MGNKSNTFSSKKLATVNLVDELLIWDMTTWSCTELEDLGRAMLNAEVSFIH